MAAVKPFGSLKWLVRGQKDLFGQFSALQQFMPRQSCRAMATEARSPLSIPESPILADIPKPTWSHSPAIVTLYDFPSMEPIQYLEYSHEHLLLPLRRDILHRAVIYEGDKTRQGTASTKWRDQVRGSGRKIRPQKGSGRARLGDKKSPMLRGGGVAFGPHPRDFSTDLPRKIYDKAWRTALSYRYQRGQLIVVNDNIVMPRGSSVHLLKDIIDTHGWGKDFGRSSLITEVKKERLIKAAAELGRDTRVLDRDDVDVKDLLETGQLIIEKQALDRMLAEHSSDLCGSIAG
ncbi:54S ribosomal protein, mitochondrial [Myotisia sp. PD_48]|nr:54S ribosomal protein, mitochondrial [Myotisia sp. PD_48]